MTVAEDAATLRELADYHRQAGDWEGNSPTAALEHENWAETLEEVANLLDRLAALAGGEALTEPV